MEGSALLSRPRWISHAPLNLNSRHLRLAQSDLMAINHPATLVLVYCPPPSRQNGLTVTQFLQEWEQFLSHRNYSIPTVHWKHQHALWQTGHVQHQTDEEQSSWIRPLTTYTYPKSCSWTHFGLSVHKGWPNVLTWEVNLGVWYRDIGPFCCYMPTPYLSITPGKPNSKRWPMPTISSLTSIPEQKRF